LFQAQADSLFLAVDIQHHHVDVLANLENLRGMADAAPAHIRDVQQPVDAVQIDEGAEIGDVLHRSLADIARGHLGQQFLAAFRPFLLDQLAPRQNDVLAFLVDLDDLEIVGIAHVLRKVLRGGHIDLGRRQKCLDPDIDQQPAFDDRLHLAGNRAAFIANGEDAFPILLELGLLLGEDDHSLPVFEFFNQDIYFVADFDGFDVLKFVP
jgi:hypothetical protein